MIQTQLLISISSDYKYFIISQMIEIQHPYDIFTTHITYLQAFYKPKDASNLYKPTCTIRSTINAIIGDKSSMPNGGNIFLKGAKNISVKSFNVLNG